MNQVYIAVPVSEWFPKEHSNFIMIWEVEVMQDDWVFKAREGDLFHLKEYSKLSNVRNLKRLEPRSGYFLEREELEELIMTCYGRGAKDFNRNIFNTERFMSSLLSSLEPNTKS